MLLAYGEAAMSKAARSGKELQGMRFCLYGSFLCLLLGGAVAVQKAPAQAITVDTRTGAITNGKNTTETVDRRYQQIKPTHIELRKEPLDAKTRLELVRNLEAEQGFAMRPFPRGHKGLTLEANGLLAPYGESYLQMVTSEGMSAKPGERLVLSNIRIEHNHIILDLNGGPDPRHRFLRHVQVGVGPVDNPVVPEDNQEPAGARLTLNFEKGIPELTASEVKALLAPLISFDVKTPVQAFTDTLPTVLKDAILNHKVLVGMSTEMLLFSKGQPEKKLHEVEGQTPFDEWIYGHPPQDVQFVRIHGNRVIRLEVARVGETPEIFTRDEVSGLLRSDGSPLTPVQEARASRNQMGDVDRDPDRQAAAAPPSLRKPGETLPDDNKREGVMQPVRFPKQNDPASTPDGTTPATKPAGDSNAGKTTSPPLQPPPADNPANSSTEKPE
jgi:hypothetical protein